MTFKSLDAFLRGFMLAFVRVCVWVSERVVTRLIVTVIYLGLLHLRALHIYLHAVVHSRSECESVGELETPMRPE